MTQANTTIARAIRHADASMRLRSFERDTLTLTLADLDSCAQEGAWAIPDPIVPQHHVQTLPTYPNLIALCHAGRRNLARAAFALAPVALVESRVRGKRFVEVHYHL